MRFVVPAAIFAVVLWIVDWGKIRVVLANADYALLTVGFGVYLVTVFVQGTRWYALAGSDGQTWPFWRMQRANFVAMFFDLFTPGKLGSDAYRVMFFRKERNVHHVVSALVVMRMQGLIVSSLTVGVVAFALPDPGRGYVELATLCLAAGIGGLVVTGLLMRKQDGPPCETRTSGVRSLPGRVLLHGRSVATAMREMHGNHLALLAAGALMVLFLLVAATTFAVVGHAFGMDLPFGRYLFGVPLLMLASVIPITVHGRGISELIALQIWVGPGASTEQVFLATVAVYVLALLQGLLAGLYWSALRRSLPSREALDGLKPTPKSIELPAEGDVP